MSGVKRRERLSAGLEYWSCKNIRVSLNSAKESGYEFVVVPVAEPKAGQQNSFFDLKDCPESRADLTLDTVDWNNLVVFRTSSDISCDHELVDVRMTSEKRLLSEFTYASYLAVPAVLLTLSSKSNVNLARIVYNHCYGLSNFTIWVEVPICVEGTENGREVNGDIANGQVEHETNGVNVLKTETSEDDEYESDISSWQIWNEFRMINNYNKRVAVVLRITENLPSSKDSWRNWIAEPVKALVIDTEVFLSNKTGYPVLSQAHQIYICRLFTYFPNLQIIVTGTPMSGREREISMTHYYQYLNHLFSKRQNLDSIDEFSIGYENFLQVPLQPLADHLESQTYEVFEKDPVKYPKYQEAVQLALKDKLEVYPDRKLVLMVLGAGRGPLVTCCMEAAKEAKINNYIIYAVEKNPNAVVTLEYKKRKEWKNNVHIIACDMRDANIEDKADIIVSELLGSFGDNELSPECLDGANSLLKPDAISIPTSYSSYIAPVSSHILHVECTHSREFDKATDHCLEIPYVVRLVNYTSLGDPKNLFTFNHPNWDEKIDNTRQGAIEFVATASSVVNGIAGYFDTVLYKDVGFSIVPETHSEGMFSWFPIYFPLKSAVNVKKGEKIKVHFWRCEDRHKVWYEWCISSPFPTATHNPKGRSYFIGK